LRRQHRPVQARTVVADDGQVHAALETECRQAARQGAHFGVDLLPVPGLPDAQVLFAERRLVRPLLAMLEQPAWEGRQIILHECLLGFLDALGILCDDISVSDVARLSFQRQFDDF
jgi:hypothetical protein